MEYTIKTGLATIERDIAADSSFLNVPWQIVNEAGEVLHEAAQAFPLGTEEAAIRDALATILETFKQKEAGKAESQAAQAANDSAQSTAGSVSNISLN